METFDGVVEESIEESFNEFLQISTKEFLKEFPGEVPLGLLVKSQKQNCKEKQKKQYAIVFLANFWRNSQEFLRKSLENDQREINKISFKFSTEIPQIC